ncbi:bifunctional methyltransferase/pyrophosphohydrolase YabN [Heliomicrobium gestii]|nr:nucleoside triphosphate pyrophosphohydrolase [Heliomicrobium gestii]MBM7866401.1 tetrapyrrole methylase family protein/MazG family protein [Heliomicrobium gestii]
MQDRKATGEEDKMMQVEKRTALNQPAITVVGLGAGDPGHLTRAGWEALRQADRLFLRTAIHPTVPYLMESGFAFATFDSLYESADSFDDLYREIARRLIEAAELGPITFAVPGHPRVGEKAVALLLDEARRRGWPVAVIPGVSFLEALYTALGFDPARGLTVLDGLDLAPEDLDRRRGTVITQVYAQRVASDVKLTLMDVYGDEHPITVIRAAGVAGEERIAEIPLYELDRLDWVDHLTSVYVPPLPAGAQPAAMSETGESGETVDRRERAGAIENPDQYALDPLVEVMGRLLAPEGCPWDREQTHQSLKPYLLEEAYEVLEAIDLDDDSKLKEELGDVLLQVVFHGLIAEGEGRFRIGEIVETITEKMIRRHPHVFADTKVANADEVLVNWEAIKAKEKGDKPAGSPSGIDRVSTAMPSLLRAEKVQKKAAQFGFDWPDEKGPLAKVREEWGELLEAAGYPGAECGLDAPLDTVLASRDASRLRDELGDLLFAVVNVSRFLRVNPEEALQRTVDKFIGRFRFVEDCCRRDGREMARCALEELDVYWEQAKQRERENGRD